MTITINWYIVILLACVAGFILGIRRETSWLIIPPVIVATVTLIVWTENSEWKQEERRQEAEAARRAAIPHVIREADGCKVYAFTAGGKEHYFTRCADSVTTDRSYDVKINCGKNCTRTEHHVETIVTKKEPK